MNDGREGNLARAKYENSSRGQTADVNNIARVKGLANKGPLNAVMTIEPADRSYRRLAAVEPR